ncbi:MAG: 2Fe-2S iron-sulfur cluster-binding protein [Sinobacteraceae bacterium]|nr:2Fe-2S iron-sulfur cluster-binding protein [Nevskiaceae bacterium]
MNAHVAIVGCNDVFSCAEDVDVLHAMMALGRKGIPVGCRGGGCGVCKVRVLSGEYSTGRMSRARVTEEEEKQGFALACKLYAQGDLRLEVVGKMSRAFAPDKGSVHRPEMPCASLNSTS